MMNSDKLLELRAKTDRQLLDFVHYKLEAGLQFVGLFDLDRAECALREAEELLPAIHERQRRELYPKVGKLRDALALLRHRESRLTARFATGESAFSPIPTPQERSARHGGFPRARRRCSRSRRAMSEVLQKS